MTSPPPAPASRDIVPRREALRAWFGISLRTFGGPAGQIAVMHRELVDERRWIGEQRFLHALSFCTLLPGPEAQQLAIYLGWLLNGTAGGLIAGLLFVLPGYLAMMALSAVYAEWGATLAVNALFAGLGPAVLAIVAQALWRIARRALTNAVLVAIAIGAFVALFIFGLPFPIVIAGAALAGYAGQRLRPALFTARTTAKVGGIAPLIADDSQDGGPSEHTERQEHGGHAERRKTTSLPRGAKVLAIGLVLWFAPVVAAALAFGRSHVFVDQGLFFSGSAVVTFGGAYAVLSFVAQRAVDVYGWLQPGEMINGLALAETTPGPLIMVVQFVAFIGAYRNPGTLHPWVAAVVGATLAVWVTFVPCFLFVFLGAPHVEGLRSNRRLSAALTGITAAVVGVIANLSLYFSTHTLFSVARVAKWGPIRLDSPVWSSFSPRAAAVAAVAVVLVFRFRVGVLRVLAICAVGGAAIHIAAS